MNFEGEPLALKHEKISKSIADLGIEGIFITSIENVYYFTGAPVMPGTGNPILFALRNRIPFFAYLSKSGEVTLFVWFGVTMGVEYQVDDVRSYMDMDGGIAELSSFIEEKEIGLSKVGIESNCPYYVTDLLRKSGISWIVIDYPIKNMRLVKRKEEILLIRKATEIAESTVKDLGEEMKIGMTRQDLARKARLFMIEHGANSIDHITLAFGPSNPEVMIDESLKAGQIITVDLGAIYEGYVSDTRRLFYSGKIVPERTEKLYRTMVGIVDKIGEALIPGRKFGEIYDLAVRLYADNALEPMFVSAGHSIGIVTEEEMITQGCGTEIENNMILNIELYAPDDNGVMIGDEETYLIQNGSSTRITELQRKIFQV
ncbi:MAG: M24 family metallopeptidase [Candidatus Thermoplasmatota archaeon]|jgi:Xaa-Pro aminopeptidase|nr:M24 family metallopeptidase [Candidatus Thermoplasmatota archaeon]